MGLSEGKCWPLFQKHAFDYQECYARELSVEILGEVGKKIIRRCGGLPLAVTMIAALLGYERDVNKWIDVLENSSWESDETTDTLLLAVCISYEYMPSYQCLAYCFSFPVDYKFNKEKLVNFWVTVGLIQPRRGKSIGELGRGYFDELCRRSFLQRCIFDDDFCLPDLIHKLINKPEYSVSLLQTNLRTEDATVYCREEDETKLIEILLSDDRRKYCVTIVRVFGASGIGKTTFVNLVYNNSTICEIFEKRAWVCANDKLDLKGMMKAILESLTGVSCSLTELTEIQAAVKEELAGKSFFIVLDNICSDYLSFWNSLLVPLSMGAKGSTIVATTDSEVVINTDMIYSHELKRLSKKDSSFVLQQVVFDGRDYRTDINLTRIVKHISTKCEGLPLVLRAFGGIMRAELDANSWAALLGNSSIAFDEVSPPLRLSYRQLNEHLKRCFEYCSLFPKGHMFEKDHLVRLWMSQGFIENKQGKHEHDTANEYFDELLKRSFFQHSPNCHPKEKKFVMHDLFHELAESVSTNKCFRTETYELSCIPEQVCHLSLIAHEFEITVETASFQDLRDNITTLLVINKFAMKCKGSIHLQIPAILNDLFANLRLLRTLDLSNTNIELIPESIAYLQLLRYLSLSKTRIRSLPESLCSLYNLQTLELRDCSYLSELPAYVKNLVSLIHLDVSKECGFVFMPSGIGQLTSLLTLSTFTIGRNERHCGIKELKELINLRGELCIGGIGNVLTGDEAKEAELETKEKLTSLTLQWLNCAEDLQDDQSTETASEVLQNFLPNHNLEELTIRDYSGHQFPSWMGDQSFSKLISLILDNCSECDILPQLGQLPSLKHLSIRMIEGVKCIGHEVCGCGSSRGFPSLETLKLWEMSELEELCLLEDGGFPCLRKLCISRCNQLKRLPCFVSLMELSIHCCTQLPDLPPFPSLKSLIIEGIEKLQSLPRQFHLPALKFVEIRKCDQLTSVEALSQIAYLEKLKVTSCPKLINFSTDELLAPQFSK